jgi:hypothetical protein
MVHIELDQVCIAWTQAGGGQSVVLLTDDRIAGGCFRPPVSPVSSLPYLPSQCHRSFLLS